MRMLTLAALIAAAPATAGVVYEFDGECDFGCVGEATLEIRMKETYIPGANIVCGQVGIPCNVALIDYFDSETAGIKQLPNTMSMAPPLGFAEVSFAPADAIATSFMTHFDGSWRINLEGSLAHFPFPPHYIAGGSAGTWGIQVPQIPEPGMLALLLALGLAGFVVRKKRNEV